MGSQSPKTCMLYAMLALLSRYDIIKRDKFYSLTQNKGR